MTDLLSITEIGDPILRQKADPLENILDPAWQGWMDRLIATGLAAKGVGIAAPQVSQSCRLFVVASRPNGRYPHAPQMEPTVMINPSILGYSGEMVKDWEGCLSVPGVRGLVKRDRHIEVSYLDRWGQPQQGVLTDFVARIFQHELDHLDGILFVDRLESEADRFTEEEYQALLIP
ncbi:peptide deformylase [Spirulina subsalsa FACHB-351]|uniref:Peptide deformylase n=1 Tax=Spirulina subsalsa FACHB-351 TaxID=234711 RepID=A0ABT3KZL2_9CYAN|nr:peptide deformylase [Spirulina subsalsa]MCW6034691.1 peptide deformylase [Spirulina subsalsa FACHB-351]